jgi:hypothetical protein
MRHRGGAPNYDEGRVAESRADFSHKVNIALKELVETEGWLKFVVIAGFCQRSNSAIFKTNAVSSAEFSILPSPRRKDEKFRRDDALQ